jgi:Tol biopolymer transport system component
LRTFACLLVVALVSVVVLPAALAQTPEENDESAAEARRNDTLPLVATRTMSFDTSEGTWMSLDLSPDGQTIVFELLGDLYTLPVAGGAATRITSGQAYDMQPRFSPDGSRIVFVSDRTGSENLWIADADGENAEALTEDERESYMSPVWADDDYVIANKGTQLWMYHVDGGNGVQITGLEDGAPAHIGAALGADDRYVWLNVRGNPETGFDVPESGAGLIAAGGASAGAAGPESGHGHANVAPGPDHDPGSGRSSAREVGPYQLGQLDRDTGRVHLRTHEHIGAFRPMPSPDGRWVAYATRYDAREAFKLLDLTTGDDQWLLLDVQRDESQGGGMRDRDVYPGSAWTPDSSALITSYGGGIWRVAVPSGEATEIPFTAHVEQELGPLAKFDYPIDDDQLMISQIRGARPSPDGARLAFTALDKLWIGDLPQGRGGPTHEMSEPWPTISDARRLTGSDDVEHAPVWSPDGQWIAYVTWSDVDGGNIWRVRADGSTDPERLTPTAAFFDKITYSRDGSRIVAVRGSKMHRMRTLEDFGSHSRAAELEYVWLPANGGEPTRIAWVGSGATQQGRNAPHVGPDPERIYVWAGSDGLISMRFDGTDVRPVVKVTAPSSGRGGPSTPDEVVLAPDGTHALVRANRNVFMVTVPPYMGTAPTVSAASSSAMPRWRLTDIGGDFVGWNADGSQAFYSIGRSFFLWDLAREAEVSAAAEAAAEAEEAAEEAGADDPDTAGGDPDAADDPEAQEEQEAEEEEEEDLSYAAHRVDVEIVVPKDKPEGTVVLRGARLITMRGDEVIEEGDIVVTDNRISAIGPSGEVDIPDGAEVLDMSGKTIYPGLVDIHAHTWVAWGVHRGQVSQFLAQLAFGVTTQRDPQTSSEDAMTYFDLMEAGELIGPRVYSTGPGIFSNDNIRSLDDARDVLERYSEHYNTKTIKQYLAGDRKVRQWVIMAAHELGLTPTTEGGSNFTMNLTLMQDGYAGLEHTLPISPLYEDVIELGRFSGITYTPTLIVAYGGPSGRQYYLTHVNVDENERLRTFTPHDELDKWKATQWYRDDQYVHFLHAEHMKRWIEAGGKLGLGSHGEVQGIGTHWELWMMASGGMDNHDALRMATLDSADAIGLAGDLGSLDVGKLADLQVLDENPLEDLHNTTSISHVMKNGRLYEADTLTEIWPRQKPLPEMWWWRVEPDGSVPSTRDGGQ